MTDIELEKPMQQKTYRLDEYCITGIQKLHEKNIKHLNSPNLPIAYTVRTLLREILSEKLPDHKL